MTEWLNQNAGWWAVLGLPLMAAAAIVALAQLRVAVVAATVDDAAIQVLLINAMRRQRLRMFKHEDELVAGGISSFAIDAARRTR
jgi:hypothetical protein